MPALVKATVKFPPASGLPEDTMTNNWHFLTDDPAPTVVEFGAIAGALSAFYGTDPDGGGAALAVESFQSAKHFGILEPEIDFFVGTVADGVAGSPEHSEDLVNWVPANQNPLPAEVAVCLSFHGDLTGVAEETPAGPAGPAGDIHGRARKRGRIYIPGLGATAVDAGSALGAPMHPNCILAIREAAIDLASNADLATFDIDWVVYSKAGLAAATVVGGWVDNAFDTQRRRGLTPTTRGVW